MTLLLIVILLGLWVLFMTAKFYRRMDWDEPPDPSPDLQGMRKRQAELLRIQEILEEAAEEGKLSRPLLDEYHRFCEAEIETMEAEERAWKSRKPRTPKLTVPSKS